MNRISREEMQRLQEAARQSPPCGACFHRRRCPVAQPASARGPHQRALARGELLEGAALHPARVRVVRSGAFKTRVWTRHGMECILGFHEGGDLVGLHGASSALDLQVVALESGSVCEIELQSVAGAEQPLLSARLRRALAEELDRARMLHVAVATMPVRERLAGFLLDLSRRQCGRGLRGDLLGLRMSREDIGHHLGARLETISRELGALRRQRVIALHRRELRILQRDALVQLAGEASSIGS
jgi:CRP/FNR family transcriptional regulator